VLIHLTLIGKPGCHLCEDADGVVAEVVREFEQAHAADGIRVEIEQLNILEDASLALQYSEEIPVLQINGKTHGYWRIEPVRFRAALEKLATEPSEGN
jgi:hypothetical protein